MSVVMPVHNGARFLSRAVDSILEQTFRDFELIVVDDGSTDSTPSILDSYAESDSRVRVFHNIHSGISATRTFGCKQAIGEYLAPMDADDIALSHRFEMQTRFLDARPEVGLVGGAIVLIDDLDQPLLPIHYPREDRAIRERLVSGSPFAQSAVMMRREAFECAGGYRAAFAPAEDYDLFLRVSEGYKLANLAEFAVHYRVHSAQVSSTHPEQQVISAVGAQVAARIRQTGGSDPLGSIPALTIDLLLKCAPPRFVFDAAAEAAAGRAGLLVLLGREAEALQVLRWARSICPGTLSRRPAAKMHLAYAGALLRQRKWRDAVLHAASASFTDPQYMLSSAWTSMIAFNSRMRASSLADSSNSRGRPGESGSNRRPAG